MQMVRDYAAERGVATAAQTMPTTNLEGGKVPTTKRDIEDKQAAEERDLPNDIDQRHKKKVARTGYAGTAPVAADTSVPTIVTAMQGDVRGSLDQNNKDSIPARAAALDENAAAWASADKKLGEGRANPMAVVEDMEGRDIKDTGLKIWDKLTGGDGTADGEKLTDNQKRETGSTVKINQPGKK
jgi:conjugal transfer mating pair stabilization protein TraG